MGKVWKGRKKGRLEGKGLALVLLMCSSCEGKRQALGTPLQAFGHRLLLRGVTASGCSLMAYHYLIDSVDALMYVR